MSEGENVRGIDFSHYQKAIDFPQTFAAGYVFAFIKATEWGDYQDPLFAHNWLKSKEAGFLRSAYHFYREIGPSWQLENFTATVGGAGGGVDQGELPPMVDYEIDGGAPDNLRLFLRGVEANFGRRPIIYTSPRYWFKPAPAWTEEYDLFLADWTPPANLPKGWKDWRFWQQRISAKGEVPGISTRVDLGEFNGDQAALLRYAGLKEWPGQAVTPQPAPAAGMRFRVKIPLLNVRAAPSIGARDVGDVRAGDVLTARDVAGQSAWIEIEAGRWVCVERNGARYLEVLS